MYTVNEIMQFIAENDVKFIRLSFCDLQGRLKNISVMPPEIESAFTNGCQIDASPVFGEQAKTLRLFPVPSTLMAMPWRPAQGRVIRFFCDLRNGNGTPFDGDCRHTLKPFAAPCTLLINCGFFLLKTDENGEPTDKPWDNGGYMDVSPTDKGENVRREICLSLEEMKIPVHASYHGGGAGQNIIEFKAQSLLEAGDFIVAFKSCAQAIAARNGLYAAFPCGTAKVVVTTADGNMYPFDADCNPYTEIRRLSDRII